MEEPVQQANGTIGSNWDGFPVTVFSFGHRLRKHYMKYNRENHQLSAMIDGGIPQTADSE
jgi:hypothetical protein